MGKNNGDDVVYIIHDDEPDPAKMSKEEYFKALDAYISRGKEQSEKMRKRIAEYERTKGT
jgi:hypothetical protein